MWGSAIRFSKVSDTPCSICAQGVTLELSKTDEHGLAVHELCYVQATLAGFRNESLQLPLPDRPQTPAIVLQEGVEPESGGSFWKPFEFVRW